MSAGISRARAKGLAGTAEVRRDISPTSDHADHAGPYSPTASTARKWILRSLSLIVCGILVCVVTLSVLLLHRVRPTVAVNSPAATAAKLREELASQAGPGRSKTPRTLHINEADLNSILEEQMAKYRAVSKPSSGTTVGDVRVRLVADRVIVYLTCEVHRASTTITIEGKLHSREGYLDFDPTSMKVGLLPIPDSAVAEAFRQVTESPRYRQITKLPPYVSEMYIANNELITVYRN